MLDTALTSIFGSTESLVAGVSTVDFLLCCLASIVLAVLFTIIVAIVNVGYMLSPFGKQKEPEKTLKITIPDDLEYDGVFDDVLKRYTDEHELTMVQTTNMGSLFLLEYAVRMKQPGTEKRMIDELRCRNGNLKITCGRAAASKDVL